MQTYVVNEKIINLRERLSQKDHLHFSQIIAKYIYNIYVINSISWILIIVEMTLRNNFWRAGKRIEYDNKTSY